MSTGLTVSHQDQGSALLTNRAGQAPTVGARLRRAVVASAGGALLVSGLIMTTYLYWSLKAAMVDDVTVKAKIVAENSAAAIVFSDAKAAGDTLAGLSASSDIQYAELHNLAGKTVAKYAKSGSPPGLALLVKSRLSGAHAFVDDRLLVQQPVMHADGLVGTVHIVANTESLHTRLAFHIGVTALVSAAAFAIAFLSIGGIRREVDATERRLDTLAYFDPVSGLPNRHACNEALDAALGNPRTSQGGFAVLLLDLDDFKYVNDTLGHEVGDALLKQLATRIRSRLRKGDRSFRLGGDEFLVLAPCPADPVALRELGMLAVQALEAPIEVGAHSLHARISVGVAHFPTDAEDVSGLLRAADTAMYEAKKKGKNTCVVFHPSMQRDGDRRMRIEQELRSATERGEFHLLFQPIVDLRERRMVGVEALIRWRHPDLGLVSPAEFIPLAERSGSILEIGQWVLKEACRQMKLWISEGLDDIYVAVNVSARQVKRGLAQQIGDALAEAQLPSHHLEIELTEHSLVEDIDANVEQLRLLERAGVRIAIDDFGTGLSSLAYLKRLPIEKLKIDRTFVKDLPDNRDDSAIVSAIVSLAKTLNLTVVAEGIETEAQRDHLRELGCDNGQGFFYSRPVEPGLITKFAARSLRGPAGAVWQPSAFATPSPFA